MLLELCVAALKGVRSERGSRPPLERSWQLARTRNCWIMPARKIYSKHRCDGAAVE